MKSNLQASFAALLKGFEISLSISIIVQKQNDRSSLQTFMNVITGFATSKTRWQLRQRNVADSFNILDVLRLTGNEVRHSMVLAWMLDKDMDRHGTHAQGSLGFEQFLKELKLPSEYASETYWVRREVVGEESRVDVEIAARGSFLIHIENKIWSNEGHEQTMREWADIERRAVALNVQSDCVHCIYLTPDGRAARHASFQPLSWYRMQRVLEAFAELAIPPEVKIFAKHYARALSLSGISQMVDDEIEGDKNDERNIQ
jgi:hypothetical protein